jgi:hypothetical protein
MATVWLQPIMHNPPATFTPTWLVTSAALMAIGLAWTHHSLTPGAPIAGAARWRDRGRALRHGIRHALHALLEWQGTDQPLRWWVTRIEFGLAAAAAVIGTGAMLVLMPLRYREPAHLEAVGLAALAYAGIWAGMWWMRRIYLAPIEVDPEVHWRYRDR